MPGYVVDASVAAKWYFEEEHSAQAALLLTEERFDLVAPDFIRIEVAAVAWKRVIRGEIESAKAESIVSELLGVPMDIEPAVDVVAAAMKIALQTRRSVYDAIYLALAVESGRPLVTGDWKFFEAIKGGPFAAQVVWVGDLA